MRKIRWTFGSAAAAVSVAVLGCAATVGPVASANIPFQSSSTLNSEVCTIEVLNGGTMFASTDGRVLSSREAGGTRGRAIVTSRKFRPSALLPFRVTVDAPSGFDAHPATGNNGVSFTTRMFSTSIYRGITMNNRRGDRPRSLRRNGLSIQEITIDLIATKPAGQTFAPGTYEATTILRCE